MSQVSPGLGLFGDGRFWFLSKTGVGFGCLKFSFEGEVIVPTHIPPLEGRVCLEGALFQISPSLPL